MEARSEIQSLRRQCEPGVRRRERQHGDRVQRAEEVILRREATLSGSPPASSLGYRGGAPPRPRPSPPPSPRPAPRPPTCTIVKSAGTWNSDGDGSPRLTFTSL